MPFQKGHKAFFKHKLLSKEHKEKIRKSMKGKPKSKTTKQKMSEAHRGEKCYNWQGGISNYPYSVNWTLTLKISIRERDRYTCQLCGEKQGDKAHAIHHIDYDKENCDPKNLITLCNSCHNKTNFNRKYWIKYFNNLQKE